MKPSMTGRYAKTLISVILIFLGINHAGGETIEPEGLSLTIECEPIVNIDSVFNIWYNVTYEGRNRMDLSIDMENFDEDKAKFLQDGKVEATSLLNGKITITKSLVAKMKATEPGRFKTPGCVVTRAHGYASEGRDTLDFPPVYKYIDIVKDVAKAGKKKAKRDADVSMPDEIIRLITCLDRNNICLGDSVVMKVKLQSNLRISACALPGTVEIDNCYYGDSKYVGQIAGKVTVDGQECDEWIIMELVL